MRDRILYVQIVRVEHEMAIGDKGPSKEEWVAAGLRQMPPPPEGEAAR